MASDAPGPWGANSGPSSQGQPAGPSAELPPSPPAAAPAGPPPAPEPGAQPAWAPQQPTPGTWAPAPAQASSGCRSGCVALVVVACVLFALALFGIIALIFIGGQVSAIRSGASASAGAVATTVSASPATSVGPSASTAAVPSGAASSDPYAGQPYSLTLPSGWIAFDPSSPSNKAALDEMAKANPALAPAITSFESSNLYRLAVNTLTGNLVVTAAIPTQGMTLDQVGQSLSAQIAAVPGASAQPSPEATTLPAGNALHWTLSLSANKAGGGSVSVTESVYFVQSGQTGVLVEFVTPSGGVPDDEGAILNSLVIR